MTPRPRLVLVAVVGMASLSSILALGAFAQQASRISLPRGGTASFDCPTELNIEPIDEQQSRVTCDPIGDAVPPTSVWGGVAPSATPTRTPVPTSTRTPVPTSTRTATPTRTASATPTATRTSTPTRTVTPTIRPLAQPLPAAPMNITFDNRGDPGAALNGQYPAGVINWGIGAWSISGPRGGFTTRNVGFGRGTGSAVFTILAPMRLVSFQAYNGGPVSTVVTLTCSGQPLTRVTLTAGQLATIATSWMGPCSSVTLSADWVGWTSFDNFLLYPSGGAD